MKILNTRSNLSAVANNSPRRNRSLWHRGGAIATILMAGLFVACDSPRYDVRNPNTTTEVEDVAEDTQQLIGQTVTVAGEVEEIAGSNAFVLEGNDLLGDESVLVINAQSTVQPITEGEDIRVTGEVGQFTMAEFERDYDIDWDLDVKSKIEAEFQNKPVIVADFTEVL